MPELPSAIPAPRPAITRWASASPPPPPVSWATATPSSIVPARSNSRTTCAPRSRRSMPPSWSARPTRRKLPQLQIILRELEDLGIPRFLFLNKIDRANKRIRETLATLQPASRIPLVLRQIPIWNGDLIAGFVDLALERAFVYREHKASEVVALEGGDLDREKEARFSMLEKLADHDDALMEQLLEDIPPPRDAVFDDLARELREGLICPVLLGSALRENGVLRLMKALRHEAPGVTETAKRLGASSGKDALAYVFKTHASAARRQAVADARACRAISTTARRCSRRRARPAGYPASLRSAAPTTASAPRPRPATRSRSASSTPSRPATRVSSGKTAPSALVKVEPAPPVLAMALVGQRPQGRRQARPGLVAAQRGRSVADHDPQSAHPRHRAVGAGRDASAGRAGAAARPLRRQRQIAAARDRLSGDHPQVDHPARPAQEAIRRPWPVRRRGAGDQAAAARRRL